MSESKIISHSVEPYFDLETFMNLSHETRLGGAQLERLAEFWNKWLAKLCVKELNLAKRAYLAVWLPEEIETEVDAVWSKSASEGFLFNNLAQYLCMATIQELIPEVDSAGCAPSPIVNDDLRKILAEAGLPCKNTDSVNLSLRYAVLTYFPFKGGCEICQMRKQCPKGNGLSQELSIVLPGHEREECP